MGIHGMERVWEKQQGSGRMWATQPTARVFGSWLVSSADVQSSVWVGKVHPALSVGQEV